VLLEVVDVRPGIASILDRVGSSGALAPRKRGG
jgi:hypothetical protein